MLAKKRLTPDEALKKIKHYCAYQERSHREVTVNLYAYGLFKKEVDSIVSNLIQENFLNEERFAVAYAGGKFRMKNWGRKKIEYELKQKGVSTYNIRLAMQQIENDTYLQTLEKLAEAKWKSLVGEHYLTRQAKTHRYLLGKGYESSLIANTIQQLRSNS